MLIKLRFHFPEIMFGIAMAVAIFAMGAVFQSSQYSAPTTNEPSAATSSQSSQQNKDEKRWWQDAVAIFTLALVFVGGAQAILFYVQLKLIRENLIDARDAAVAAKDSVNAQRDEFAATHRPKIRIKHFYLADDIWGGEAIKINIWLVNNGTTDALLGILGYKFFVVRNDRNIPLEPEIPDVKNLSGAKLPCGLNARIENVADGTVLTPEQNVEIQNGRAKLYCVGYIDYRDSAGRLRITGFCRVLAFPPNGLAWAHSSRFYVFDDPDYEYQD